MSEGEGILLCEEVENVGFGLRVFKDEGGYNGERLAVWNS